MLYQTYASQKTYGDKAQMMEYRDGMFQMVLGDFTFSQVKLAFLEHVRRKPDLPTPSDIVNIIEPPMQPLSSAVYVEIKKRIREGNVYVDSDEKSYCQAFESQELAKIKGGTPELRQAQREIDNYAQTFLLEQ